MKGVALHIPTFMVHASFNCDLNFGDGPVPKGTIVPVAYGIALQAVAMGFGAIQNDTVMHAEASAHLAVYGPDGWFPAGVQTINKLGMKYALIEKDHGTA